MMFDDADAPVTHKEFPPGLGLLKVPLQSRKAALAGLSMYAPCAIRGIAAKKAAWLAASILGPRVIPGQSVHWVPPMDSEIWSGLKAAWRDELGAFDGMAVYERVQAHRPGLALLLLREEEPIAFVKLRRDDGKQLEAEARALRLLGRYDPTTFFVPSLLGEGSIGGWHYVTVEAIPAQPHHIPTQPPIPLIVREIEEALTSLPKAPDTPEHWRPMHGDLTPWNLRELPDRRLMLIDWEESGWGPPGADELLYRATAAPSRRETPCAFDPSEAIAFWQHRIGDKPTSDRRDQRLLESLGTAFVSMRRPDLRPDLGDSKRPHVLVFAYACEPERGSEPGAGWGLVRALETFADCTVLVGPEHTPALRRWEKSNPESTLRFVEVPESRFADWGKFHRLPWFLVYQRWLRTAREVARRLHEEEGFDAMYHATYATYWLPTPASEFGVPCIWGPVGGAVTTPLSLWPALGLKGMIGELLDMFSVRLAALRWATRKTWFGSNSRIVQNEETLHRLPTRLQQNSHLLSHVNFVEIPKVSRRERGSHVVWFSSLEPRKGPRLAIHALAHTPAEVRLHMIGDGPERAALERLAVRLGVRDRVDFFGHVAREQLLALLSEASCAVFTNLREEGGVALAEAMLTGTASVVLSNGGTRVTATSAIDPRRVRLIPATRLRETAKRMGQAMTEFSRNPPASNEPNLDQSAARLAFRRIFEDAMARPIPVTDGVEERSEQFGPVSLSEGRSLS